MRYPACVRVNPCYAPILKLGNKLNRAKVGCALGVCPESVRQARAAHFNAAFYSTCFGDLLNLLLACEPLAGWRQVAVTQRAPCRTSPIRCVGWWMKPTRRSRWCAGPGQSEYPSPSVAVRDFPGGGPADCEAAGVPLHPEARQLVEHGGNRVQRIVPLLPEATAPRRAGAPAGNPDPGAGAQRRPNHHQLAVQHPVSRAPR